MISPRMKMIERESETSRKKKEREGGRESERERTREVERGGRAVSRAVVVRQSRNAFKARSVSSRGSTGRAQEEAE
jgi:hypothetical protein